MGSNRNFEDVKYRHVIRQDSDGKPVWRRAVDFAPMNYPRPVQFTLFRKCYVPVLSTGSSDVDRRTVGMFSQGASMPSGVRIAAGPLTGFVADANVPNCGKLSGASFDCLQNRTTDTQIFSPCLPCRFATPHHDASASAGIVFFSDRYM